MPSVKKRGDTYRIMVSQGYDIYGKQIRKTTSYTPPDGVTEGKAEKLAMAYAFEFEKRCQGMTNMNENIRFSELAEWYYTQVAVHKLKPATFANNRTLMDLYVLPYIGNMKLKEINTARIDALFNELHRDDRKREAYRLRDVATLEYGTRRPLARKSGVNMNTLRTLGNGGTVIKDTAERIADALGVKLKDVFIAEEIGGGLDVGTIKRIRTALSPIFSTAVKKELLLKNPVTNATTPAGEEKERLYLDAGQCKELMTFLDEFSNPQLPRVIKTLMYTGMRVGELTVLHWEEVNLDKAMITVKYNLYRLDGEYRLSTPKTKSSARVIALPPQLVEILREQKVWQDERRKATGSRWLERGAVFTGSYGEYMAKSYINLQFKPPVTRQLLCTDVEIDTGTPEQAFIAAWNRMADGDFLLDADPLDDPLIRYRKRELILLVTEIGRIDTVPFGLMLQTLDCISVHPDGSLEVLFLAGVQIQESRSSP